MNFLRNMFNRCCPTRCTVSADGTKIWCRAGLRHREGGPAFEDSTLGIKAWYRNGQLDRTGGPAVEFSDGSKAWYTNGHLYSAEGRVDERPDRYKWWFSDEEIAAIKARKAVQNVELAHDIDIKKPLSLKPHADNPARHFEL
jgi:hypothetical protein